MTTKSSSKIPLKQPTVILSYISFSTHSTCCFIQNCSSLLLLLLSRLQCSTGILIFAQCGCTQSYRVTEPVHCSCYCVEKIVLKFTIKPQLTIMFTLLPARRPYMYYLSLLSGLIVNKEMPLLTIICLIYCIYSQTFNIIYILRHQIAQCYFELTFQNSLLNCNGYSIIMNINVTI